MQLDKLDIKLRERTPWEAVDLGFSLLHKYRKAVFLPWLALFLTVATLCFVLPISITMSFLLLIFLTPSVERVCLFVLSRSVFGQEPTFMQSLKAWPSECKAGFFSMNLFWRFTPSRSFILPVWQLEHLKWRQNSKRRRALSASMGMVSGTVGVLFLGFEILLIFGSIYFLLEFASSSYTETIFSSLFNSDDSFYLPPHIWKTVYWIYVLVVALLRPFYMACGFTLYLSRRMELEGWDIEVRFRSLVQRLAKTATVLALMCTFGTPCFATNNTPYTINTVSLNQADTDKKQDAKTCINEVMQDPDFHKMESRPVKKKQQEMPSWFDYSLGEKVGELFAVAVKLLVIAGVIVLLVYLLYNLVKNYNPNPKAVKTKIRRPQTILGFDLNEESLPDDLITTVRALWAKGDIRGAVSLLYRGSLIRFIDDHQVELKTGYTEGDCLRAVQGQANGKPVAYFDKLTHHWCLLAYAHISPNEAVLEAFCENWATTFTTPEPGGKS